MSEDRLTGILVIQNAKGLHTRPCAELVKCVSSFRSEVTLHYKGVQASGKSLLAILTLGAPLGANITIEAVGKDAKETIEALIALAEKKFYITY
ncbi:MAG: HPr family phosphocarrier protein [Rhabdochlamydiaceae bacterium]|jgi:phosphotransferase system HPr (HPr) family protein